MEPLPYPGMDPYIEACARREDFHGKLISEIEHALAQVWPASFREALPAITIPLELPDQDINLAIQPLVDAIYARSRYSRLLDYSRLRPAVACAESTWIDERLREWGAAK